ncbi:protein toll-like [Orbicella faveolata]|uniref:protein toll-like n=1 Tax=Orbicella faveolata TaxID=48498 RepID=UPI0009E33286|nr:protein toll-like [Orbicella faveolata]
MPRGLIELNLMSNDIRDIPAFPYLENVTVLKMTNNKVERLKASTVEKLKRVEILLIDANNLTTLPREIESLNFTTLALEQNLFKCDCTTKWMKHWLVKNRRRIRNIEKVFCNSEHALGRAIYSLPDDEFICATIKEKNTGKTVPIGTIAACTLGGLLALILIVGIVLYKYYREVKVFMYTHFNWHPFDRIDDSDPNKIYDAFISFSGNDFDWVKTTLQERLENHDPPYKLCFHHRDFPVGEPIVENIFKSVDQSKRMLVVLSSSYAKSDWCLMEFREAHRKVLEDRMKYLIVILFDDVDTTELDEEFKLYLRTNTYLSVSDKGFWQKLYYAMPPPSSTESVEERSFENVALSGNIDSSAEILQQEALEMAHNTADTIVLVEQ